MLESRRRVCVVLVDRANYGRLKPVMLKLKERADVDLSIVAAGTLVLERFDQPVHILREDGFDVSGEVYLELEGSTPTTMAKSVGFGVVEFASEFQRLKPEIVVLIGDRYEALSAAIAAAYMNITILHLQGGEVSGSIDESARHAITKLSHYHFPSTARARDYLLRMGERPETVLGVGCPSSDIARAIDRTLSSEVVNARGAGIEIDVERPFILTIFHPTTTEFGEEFEQMQTVLSALDELGIQTLLLWPNIDAGSNHISKVVRVFRARTGRPWLRTLTNLAPEQFLSVLRRTACAVGNSSSFVRDASYFGTPVVLIGNRQNDREADEHVRRVPVAKAAIGDAIRAQLARGPYPPSTLYGDGDVATRIVDALSKLEPYVQKRLSYPSESS
ncbi:MAG TPA: UDP-N-acetylglucosamine 2-epimerase [Polyangiaceae bacterium]|jgi:UDP-hydrolysing UDP-N-acetyl-D-glucosamine 2-epimerase